MNWSSNASPHHIYWKIDSIDFLMNTYHHITNSIWHCSFLPSNSSARLDYSTLFANACTHHITAGAWIPQWNYTRFVRDWLLLSANQTSQVCWMRRIVWCYREFWSDSSGCTVFQAEPISSGTSWLQLLWQNKPFQTRRTLMTKVCMGKSIHTGYVWTWVKSCI